MNSICKGCGCTYDPAFRTWIALESIGWTEAPAWLDGVCNGCLCDAGCHCDDDDEGNNLPLTEDQFNQFLVERVRAMAARVARGLSPMFCEAMTPSLYTNDPAARCRRFPSREHDGHKLCYWHWREASRGDRMFYDPDARISPRFVAIWARDAEEFWKRFYETVPAEWQEPPRAGGDLAP